MGLMDIGQNNPYARINPLAAMIEQGMGGWNTERDRYQKLQNERLNQQQQAALLEMKQQEADRLNEQDILNSKAQQALQERRGPWSQQELASFAMQYPGTTAAKVALSVAPLVKPDKTSMQMLVENVLKDPTKYDKRTLDVVSQLTGVGVGAKGDTPKYDVEERYDDKTHTTYGRDFFWNNGKKEYVGNERPIKGRESTRINISGGGSPVQQSAFVDPSTGIPLVYDKNKGTYRPAVIEGGGGITAKPAAWTPESAAKSSLIDSSAAALGEVKKLIYDKDGKVNRGNVANAAARTWFTDGRQLDTKIKAAVEGVLRAESGAAVPDNEVKRAAERFRPQVGDSDATIKSKLDALEEFVGNTRGKIQQGRVPKASNDGIPSEAVSYLKSNPNQAAFFDMKYGKGASKRYLGGK